MFDAFHRSSNASGRHIHPVSTVSVAVIITIHIPRFALHVALRAAQRTADTCIALGPQPGDPNIVGVCSEIAETHGVAPGLRVGEALARCPELELVVPDPGAVAIASEQITCAIERIGAAVEVVQAGTWRFTCDGLQRLHGGIDGVLRQLRGALPVGLDTRIGVAPTLFSALHAARCAAPRTPLLLENDDLQEFLSPLHSTHLPMERRAIEALDHLGIRTIGQFAQLPRTAAVERFGLDGLRAWHCANGSDACTVRPRTPPQPIEASIHFPESIGALEALENATRLLIGQISTAAQTRGTAIRSLSLRVWIADGGSWTRTITLREAAVTPESLLTVALPPLREISGAVETLVIRADASAAMTGKQLSLTQAGADERRRRITEAVRQVNCAHTDAILRPASFEPRSRLPERQWALIPYDASNSPDHSA